MRMPAARVVSSTLLALAWAPVFSCGGGGEAPDGDTDGSNRAPRASFEATPRQGATPLEVRFDATASSDPDGQIITWEWDFGDGGADAGEVAWHTYTDPGSYEVVLTVTDDGGATATATARIDAEEGLIRDEASGMIHGEVWDTGARAPLEDARVTIGGVGGVVFTDAEGRFRAATPGPGTWTLTVEKAGYGYARRNASVEAGGLGAVDPVYLKPVDEAVTRIGPEGGSHASADGEVEVDVPAGATSEPLDVRVTNLDAREELPAPLPDKTDFTYCVRLQPEMADFGEPVTVRVANSLDFPPGTQIPVGIYRKDEGKWRHEALATVSDDGQWVTYETQHFSAHDINFYQRTLGENTQAPEASKVNPQAIAPTVRELLDCDDEKAGSRVDVRDGELSVTQDLPTWRSLDRLRGLRLRYASGTAAPTALVGVDYDFEQAEGLWEPDGHTVVVRVGGQVEPFRFEPMGGPHRFVYLWRPEATGEDAVGTGTYPWAVEVSNDYAVSYWTSFEFAGAVVEDTGVEGRQLARRVAEFNGRVPIRNLVDSPFGAGWGLEGVQRLIRRPDGTALIREGASGLTTFEGGLELAAWPSAGPEDFVDEGPGCPMGMDFDPEGNLVVSASYTGGGSDMIWRVSPDGTVEHVAGDGTHGGDGGDGGPATEAALNLPHGLQVDGSGDIYFADIANERVRRIDNNGIITTVAGNGVQGFSGDGGPATDAQLAWPIDVALDGEGNLYVADLLNGRVRRVDVTGTITTVAGGGASNAEGIPATQADIGSPSGVAVDELGNLYIACQGVNRVKRVDPDGVIHNATPPLDGGGISVNLGPLDAIYYRVAGPGETNWIERIGPDGAREVVAGTGSADMAPGTPAADVEMERGFHQTTDALGRLVVGSCEQSRLFRLVPSHGIPGRESAGGAGDFTTLTFDAEGGAARTYPDGTVVEFGADGYQVGRVDRNGRHTTYEWEPNGETRRLARVVGPAGLAAALRYDEAGHLSEIEDPAGRITRFDVDERGDLVRVENPDGGVRSFAYDEDHLLVERVEPMGETTTYEYDETSLALRRVVLPDGAERTFASLHNGPLLNGMTGKRFWEEPAAPPPVPEDGQHLVDATGEVRAYETNAFGTTTAIEDPTGAVIRIERDEDNLPLTVTLPDGETMHNQYDERGRITRFEDPAGSVSQVAYGGPHGAVTETVDPHGVVTAITNDAAGNPTQVAVAEGTDAERQWSMTWDALGLPLSATDPKGQEVSWEYDAVGLATSYTDPAGRTWSFEYDAAGAPVRAVDPAGHEWRVEYDAMGRVVAREDPLGNRRTYEYDLSGRAVAVVDETGARTAYAYDPMGRVTTVTDALGHDARLEYDAEGHVVRADRPDGTVTTYEYDAAHRLVRRIEHRGPPEDGPDADDAVHVLERDERGDVIAMEDADGSRWTVERDANGRMLRRTDPMGSVTEYGWDAAGRLVSLRDPRGRTMTMTYDAFGLLRRVEDDLGLLSERTFDGLGRVVESIDAMGNHVSFEYDAAGQRTAVVDEAGEALSYEYDTRGLLERVVGPLGQQLAYEYDPAGRTSARSDALGNVTTWGYDAAGRPVSMTDAEGRTTTFERDDVGRLEAITFADGSEETYAWDPVGRIVQRVLPDGRTFGWTYDDLGLLAQEDGPGAEDVTYTYHPDGMPATMDGPLSHLEFAFDAANHLTGRVENGRETTIETDTPSGQATMTYPSGLEVTYAHDLRGRLDEVRIDDEAAFTWTYDARNRPTGRSAPGVDTTYGWTPRGELSRVEHGDLWRRDYAYDERNQAVSARDAVRPERSWTWGYDANGRLTSAARGEMDANGQIPAPEETFAYAYDAESNLLTRATDEGVLSFAYDALHQVAEAAGQAVTYDATGNLAADGTYEYAYDGRGRLTSVVRAADGQEVLAVGHNPLGERILTRRDGQDVEHVTLGGKVLEERTADGEVLRRFVYGASGREPLLLMTGGESYTYLQDRIASVVGLADDQGGLVEGYDYAPYGAGSRFDAGGAPQTASAVGNPLTFNAQRLDAPMGWLHFRHRSYAPDLGRFVSRDPAGFATGGNLYTYALSDPVNVTDPDGDCPPLLLAGLVGANITMWQYNLSKACGNPFAGGGFVDFDGWEQAQAGAAGAAAGVAGAYTFGATASALGGTALGNVATYITAGAASGLAEKAAQDLVYLELSSVQEYVEHAVFGGALGGLGYGLGKMISSGRILDAVEGINPKLALAISEIVNHPAATKSGLAGRITGESQLGKNIKLKQAVGGEPGPTALANDVDMSTNLKLTQQQRVLLAEWLNKAAGAPVFDTHATHGILSDMAPDGLVIDQMVKALTGKLSFRIIPTMDLFEFGAMILKPSTGALKHVPARPVLRFDNPAKVLGSILQSSQAGAPPED
ncbi:MAG: PKD domain-containing protein [Myxococcota bacterium]